jgi:hypothetical protein
MCMNDRERILRFWPVKRPTSTPILLTPEGSKIIIKNPVPNWRTPFFVSMKVKGKHERESQFISKLAKNGTTVVYRKLA